MAETVRCGGEQPGSADVYIIFPVLNWFTYRMLFERPVLFVQVPTDNPPNMCGDERGHTVTSVYTTFCFFPRINYWIVMAFNHKRLKRNKSHNNKINWGWWGKAKLIARISRKCVSDLCVCEFWYFLFCFFAASSIHDDYPAVRCHCRCF